MANRVVQFKSEVSMAGFDHHNGLYYYNVWTGQSVPPAAPMPIPPGMGYAPQSIHFTKVPINWVSLDDKSNATVLVESHPIVSRNHAAKRTPHIPPGGNILVLVTIGFASTTWKLGVASVVATKGPVASTCYFGSRGLTLNCGDPVSKPVGLFMSPGSVHVAPTPADWTQTGFEAGVTMVAEAAATALLGPLGGWATNAFCKRMFKDVGRETAERIARDAAEEAAKKNHGVLFKKLAQEGGEQAVTEKALEKELKEVGDQAAKKAAEAVADGMDPVKAGQKGAGDTVEEWVGKQAHPGMLGTSKGEAAQEAKNHAAKNASKHAEDAVNDDLSKSWLKNAAVKNAEAGAGEQAKSVVVDEANAQAEDWVGDDEP